MSSRSDAATSARYTSSIVRFAVLEAALLGLACGGPQSAAAQDMPAFAPGMISHMHQMEQFKDIDRGSQPTPPVIPRFGTASDPSGTIGTFQPNGATFTNNNAFFQNLGTNGRTCFTCHQPQNGWTVSAAAVAERFAASGGADPIFRLVDGATCPSDDVSTAAAKQAAYQLLTEKGLIRIGLPLPAGVQFAVTRVDDPYNCNTNRVTGLTSTTTGIVSTYRRPLPATNLGFLSTIMWDGREPSLTSQATDATLGHAQAKTAPNAAQLAEIVAFESGIFTAQAVDDQAGNLADGGATGGPIALSLQLPKFFIGVNDPLGNNPTGAPFTSQIFDVFRPWLAPGSGDEVAARQSIARGEEVFNNTPIKITGVAGLNDVLNVPSIAGFCGTLPRHAQCGRSFGQGAAGYRYCGRRCQRAAGARHFRTAGFHPQMHAGAAEGKALQSHRSWPRDDQRPVRGHRQAQGAYPAWLGVARAVFPQRLGGNAHGRRELL